MNDIIKRLEVATDHDRDIDRDIWMHLNHERVKKWRSPNGCSIDGYARLIAPHYTNSVDTAFSLMPEGINVIELYLSWDTRADRGHPAVTVRWYEAGKSGKDWRALVVTAKTIPLTVCLAAMTLRAQAIDASCAYLPAMSPPFVRGEP